MSTNNENIVQHRRGTTQAWNTSPIVPYEGELVIEECIDGTCRAKIGDGKHTFNQLSYLDAVTEANIEALKPQVNKNSSDISLINMEVSNLKREVDGVSSAIQSIVDPSIEKLDAMYNTRLNTIEAQHTEDKKEIYDALNATKKELSDDFTDKLSEHAVNVSTSIEAKAATVSSELTSQFKTVDSELQKQIVDLNSKQSVTDTNLEVLNSKVNITDASLTASISRINAGELKIEELIAEVTKLKELGYVDFVTSEMIGQLRAVEAKVEQLTTSDINVVTHLYEAQASINKLIRQLKELQDHHNNDFETINNNFNILKRDLREADSENLEKITTELTKLWKEITDLVDDDVLLYERILTVRNNLNAKMDSLKAEVETITATTRDELTSTIRAKEDTLKDLINTKTENISKKLTDTKEELTGNINSVKSIYEANVKATDRSIQSVKTDIANKHTELSDKITGIVGDINQHKADVQTSFTAVDNKIIDINKKFRETDSKLAIEKDRIDSQAKQISQFIRLEDGSTTGDAELIDARINHDGKKTYDRIGDHVRSIGAELASIRDSHKGIPHSTASETIQAISDDIQMLESDFSQYTDSQAINGLHYDAKGEVGLKEPYILYLKNAEGEIIQESGVQIISGAPGTGGGPATGSLSISRITPQVAIFKTSDPAILEFTFSGTDSSGEPIMQASAEWKFNGITKAYGTVNAGNNTFDITKYLNSSEARILLVVTDSNGSTVTKDWRVRQVDLSLTSSFDDKSAYNVGENIIFTYKPVGAIDKTLVLKLDGEEIDRVDLPASKSGSVQKYENPEKFAALSHGSHLLEAYLEAYINGVYEPSDSIFKDILIKDPDSKIPLIGTATQKIDTQQYATSNIIFTVYDPKVESPTVEISVDNTLVLTKTINPNPDYNNSPTAIYPYAATEAGEHIVKITCGEAIKEIIISVESLDLDISPVTAGLVFDFNPVYGNNDILWEQNGIAMTVSENFDWINGGYIPDEVDGPCFCIKAGSTATISYKLFGDDNVKTTGKNFKLVFKTKNVSNSNATFLSCLDSTTVSDLVGIKMDVHKANIYGKTGNLEIAYSEEDVIEFGFNISGKEDPVKMVMGYEDGVPSRPMIYNDLHSFKQISPKYITLGSTDCDLYIYRLKAYNVSLTAEEILNSFILDARTPKELIARYNRNQIYDANTELDPDILAEKCPWLRVYKLSAPHFTNNKSDKVPGTTIQQIYKNGDPLLDNWICYNAQHSGQGTSSNNYGAAGRNLDFIMNKSGIADVKPYFELGDATIANKVRADKISLTRKSVPVAYLNAKVNIASSNNLTNAVLAARYNNFNPYRRPFVREAKLEDSYSEVEIAGMTPEEQEAALVKLQEKVNSELSFIKDTMEFHNCVIFIQETDPDISTHREFADNDWHFYAIGNIGDSKKTDNTRATDPEDKYECCVEIMDVGLPLADFPRDTMMNAMGYTEDKTTKEKIFTWAKPENLGILYEASYTLTEDTEINLNKTYYIDLPKKVRATEDQLTEENLSNLFERKYELTEDTSVIPDKVYYLDISGVVADKEFLQNISNPKSEGLYEWRRNYDKTADVAIIPDKVYYVEVLEKANAMAFTFTDRLNYIWAKDENLSILYEYVEGVYKKTNDTKIDLTKTYYLKNEELDADGNIISVTYDNAMGYTTEQVKTYTYATQENLDAKKLYEITYSLTKDTEIDFTKTYYIDILEHDDFSEDFTYGWRYLKDDEDQEAVDFCKQKWIDFYRFVTTSSDEEFKEGLSDYFVVDSALFYYLFTTRYCMVDNRAKNTFWHYGKTADGTRKWDLCWDYDNDTSLGLNNYGKQVYRYGLEDTDYDEEGTEVFRESDSTFFCRIRDLFAQELKEMYRNLESENAWHAESFITYCDQWQEEFPEELWRLDIERKYIRTYNKSFIDGPGDSQFLETMSNGRMKYQRRQWERSQEKYMASKYQTSLAAGDTANAQFRAGSPADSSSGASSANAVPPKYQFTLTPFSYMYLNVRYGGTGTEPITVKVTEPGKPIVVPYSGNYNDLLYVYSASNISDFGDLSAMYLRTASIGNAPRVKKFILGNSATDYKNPNLKSLTTGSNPLLEELDITNVTGLETALDLKSMTNLTKLYAFGSAVPGVLFAEGGKLDYAELPAVTDITLKNLKYLKSENFKVSDYSNVVDLVIERCPQFGSIDTLLNSCVSLQRVRLVDVDFGTYVYNDFLNKFNSLNGIDASGKETEHAWLAGTVHFSDSELSGAQYNEITSMYPELRVTYEKLASTLAFKDANGKTLYTSQLISDDPEVLNDNNGVNPVTPGAEPQKAPDDSGEFEYTFVGWSVEPNIVIGENASINQEELNYNALNNIIGDRILYPVFQAVRRTYEVIYINPTAPEAERELCRAWVPYGETDYGYGSKYYTATEPIKKDTEADPSLFTFVGFRDINGNVVTAIQNNITLYAEFYISDGTWYDLPLDEIEGKILNDQDKTMSITNTIIKLPYNPAIKVLETYTVGGVPYTVIGVGGFLGASYLELISLPDTVTDITYTQFESWGAFEKCVNLAEITFPEALQRIGKKAFYGCNSLSEIYIPANVISIGEGAFAACENLKSIRIDSNNNRYAIINNCLMETATHTLIQALPQGSSEVTIDSNTQILTEYCFDSRKDITKVVIPSAITKIPTRAFGSCENLTTVELSTEGNLTTIGASSFTDCKFLSNINLPDGLKTIGTYAFKNSSLQEIEIPSSVTTIGDHAFGNILSLKVVKFKASEDGTINIPTIASDFGKGAFEDSGEQITFKLPWRKAEHVDKFGSELVTWGANAAILEFSDETVTV